MVIIIVIMVEGAMMYNKYDQLATRNMDPLWLGCHIEMFMRVACPELAESWQDFL
mgnify:CR=1 FL=1